MILHHAQVSFPPLDQKVTSYLIYFIGIDPMVEISSCMMQNLSHLCTIELAVLKYNVYNLMFPSFQLSI